MIVKGLKQSAGKHPAGKNPILGDVEKQFGSGSGSKKKFGSGRVAGTRQTLLITHLVKYIVILQLGSEPASVEPGVLNQSNFEVDVDLGVDYLNVKSVIVE